MNNTHRFDNPPNIITAIGILLALLVLEVFVNAVFYDMGYKFEYGDPAASVIVVFSSGIIFSLVMHFTKLRYASLFHLSTNKVSSTLAVLSIPIFIVILGSFWWLTEILNLVFLLFPEDKTSIQALLKLMDGGIVSIVAICIIAPLIEEMLFRGIILRGFLSHYSAKKAIIVSSLLFALIHLNIYQIPGAFILGCFIGWIYYKSRSLWPCILAHAINNIGVYIFYVNYSELDESSAFFNFFTLLLSAIGIYALYKIFDLNNQTTSSLR